MTTILTTRYPLSFKISTERKGGRYPHSLEGTWRFWVGFWETETGTMKKLDWI